MHTPSDKSQQPQSQAIANELSEKKGTGEAIKQFVDNRPEAIAQRKLQEMANNSEQVKQLKAMQEMAGSGIGAFQLKLSSSIAQLQLVVPGNTWTFKEMTRPDGGNHQLVFLHFTNESGQEFKVHHHPGTSHVTAVEDLNKNRNDSTHTANQSLAAAAEAHLRINPVPVYTGPTQGNTTTPPVNADQARQQLALHAASHGSGAYRPGAFSAGKK